MRWFVFILFLFCFSVQAQVVCKDPNSVGGDEVTQANNVNSACRTNVTDAPQGAVERENLAKHVKNAGPAKVIKDTKTAPVKKGSSGSIK